MTSTDIFKSDLSLIQNAYGIALVLGFREIALWTFASGELFLRDRDPWLLTLRLFISATLGLLGVRFFWATGNIRRFVLKRKRSPNDRKAVTVIHFPMLLLHAFLFFILSKEAAGIEEWNSFGTRAATLSLTVLFFLIFNSFWLLVLLRGRREKEPERLWVRNNGICGAIIAAGLTVCWLIDWHWQLIGLILTVLILFANSLIDLIFRADSYMAYVDLPSFED